MDSVIDKALKRLRELEIEAHNLEQFIKTYEGLTGEKVPRSELLAIPPIVERKPNVEGTRSPQHSKTTASPKHIVEMAKRILKELNRPLTRGEILEELEKRDIKIDSPNKGKYVGTILWRNSDVFRNVEGSGYWLTDAPHPGEGELFTKESN